MTDCRPLHDHLLTTNIDHLMTEEKQEISETYTFNDCIVDADRRELTKGGAVVTMQPKAFELLLYLIRNRQRAVDKDELQDALWPRSIVTETALTRCVMKARRAVGDDADKQAMIKTVHGHGYRFTAQVHTHQEAALPPTTAAPQSQNSETLARKQTLRVAASIAGLLALIVVAWIFFSPPALDGPVRLAVLPVENFSDEADMEWTRLGLMGFANDMVGRASGIKLVPASDVLQFTSSSDVSFDEQPASPVLQALRKRYGANYVFLSKLEASTGVLRLSYRLYLPNQEVESGTLVGAEPTQLMQAAIQSILARLGDTQLTSDVLAVVSKDPFINEAYSRGLSLAIEGRCGEAQQYFEVVLSDTETDGRAKYQWANCARILGNWQEAEARFSDILDSTPTEPPSALRASAYNGLGTVYIRTGRGDLARETFRLGLDAAQRADDPVLQSKLLNSLAIDAKNRREHTQARELIARAMLIFSEADAGELPGQLPAALANIDMAEGKLAQADQHLASAIEAFQGIGDRRNEAMMLNNLGYLRRLQGRNSEAEPLHLQSLAIRQEIGDEVGQGRIYGMLSLLYLDAGRTDDARQAAADAYRIASAANDRLFMATSLSQLAAADARAGNADSARLSYADARKLFLEIEDYSRAAQVMLRIARLDMNAGNLVLAGENADAVLTLADREALLEPLIEAKELKADLSVEASDLAAAVQLYRDTLADIDHSGFVSRQSSVVIKLAHTLLDQGNTTDVEPLIGLLIEQGDTHSSLRLRARHAFATGAAPRSVELMESAKSLAEESSAEDTWSDSDEALLQRYRDAAGTA